MKPRYGNILLLIVTLILTACTATSLQAPSAMPTLVPEMLPTPASIASFEQRLQATIEIDYPDELIFVQGFIWVKSDDGHVIKVDPATNSIVAEIKVDTTIDTFHYCQGLGTDGKDIWACSAGGDEDNRTIDVVRIDTGLNSVVATVEIGKVFDQFNMPYLLNHIWVLTDNGNKLVGIDTTTNQPGPTIDLGARCFQTAPTERMLLVTCRLDNLILVVDPEKMEVTQRLTFTGARNIVATENGIWVGQDPNVVRLDPETLAPVAVFSRLGPDAGIFATTEAVWVRVEDGFVYRIDPVTNQLVEQIKTDRNLNQGSVLATSDSIWVTVENNLNGLLLRFSLE